MNRYHFRVKPVMYIFIYTGKFQYFSYRLIFFFYIIFKLNLGKFHQFDLDKYVFQFDEPVCTWTRPCVHVLAVTYTRVQNLRVHDAVRGCE